jgi:hypothetical protein
MPTANLSKQEATATILASVFAGQVYTSEEAKVSVFIEKRYASAESLTASNVVSLAKSLMIEQAKTENKA